MSATVFGVITTPRQPRLESSSTAQISDSAEVSLDLPRFGGVSDLTPISWSRDGSVALLTAGGRVERGHAGVEGELRFGAEALDVGDFGDEAGGVDGADAGHLKQRCGVAANERS